MKSIGKVVKGLLSPRNRVHWGHKDIDYFFSAKGKIVFEDFGPVPPEDYAKLAAMIKSTAV
jgi:hypothetical protein